MDVYMEKELIIELYKAIDRTHLECCTQAWRTFRKKDIHGRKSNKGKQLKFYLSYEMLLRYCGLTTLETRRLRGDHIEVYIIVNGYKHIDTTNLFLR